jgi:hypothetical protein
MFIRNFLINKRFACFGLVFGNAGIGKINSTYIRYIYHKGNFV